MGVLVATAQRNTGCLGLSRATDRGCLGSPARALCRATNSGCLGLYNFLSVPKCVLEALSACFVVDRLFKWFGHSSSGRVVDVRAPARTQIAVGVGESEVLELPCASPVAHLEEIY
jgi:hypothetical protein